LNGGEESSILLCGEKDNFSEAQFDLLCDLAVEAWAKASARWTELHGTPLTFDAVASAPRNYRSQRARNLYRPTY
jgi:hypothetical protein